MNLSGLIAQLQAVQAEHGDGRVTVAEVSFMEGTHQLVRLRYEYLAEQHPVQCEGDVLDEQSGVLSLN